MSANGRNVTSQAKRPRRVVQLVVWLLLAAALTAGLSLTSYGQPSATQTHAVTAAVAATGSQVAATPAAAGPAASSLTLAAPTSDARVDDSKLSQQLVSRYSPANGNGGDPTGLLPANRWKGSLTMVTSLPDGWVLPSSGDIENGIANLLFSFASFLWTALLYIVNMAIHTNLIDKAGGQLDQIFVQATNGIGSAGFWYIPLLAALLFGAKWVLKGRVTQAFSMLLGASLVVGGLWFMTAAAGQATKTGQAAGSVVGSPSYIAKHGNQMVGNIANTLVTGFGAVNGAAFTPNPSSAAQSNGEPSLGGATCADYITQLYSYYNHFALEAPSSSSNAELESSTLMTVSLMWQRSLYDNWTIAQMGTLKDGARITCHQLEANAHTTPQEQLAIVGGDATDGSNPSITAGKVGGYNGMGLGPFLVMPDKKANWAQMFAWAACNGGKVDAGWAQAGGLSDSDCAGWEKSVSTASDYAAYQAGQLPQTIGGGDKLQWKNSESLAQKTTPGGNATPDQLAQVSKVVSSYWGHNGGDRMFAGLLAVVSALLYLIAIGGVALGTFITQVGLMALLTIFAYTLVLLAMPRKDGGRNKTGIKLMKLTATFFCGQLMFLTLLAVTLLIMNVINWALDAVMQGMDPQSAQNASMAVPVAAILVMRSIGKATGLGDMMKMSGAAGFATKAALNAGGGKGASGKLGGFVKGALTNGSGGGMKAGGKQSAFSRLDAFASKLRPGQLAAGGTKAGIDRLQTWRKTRAYAKGTLPAGGDPKKAAGALRAAAMEHPRAYEKLRQWNFEQPARSRLTPDLMAAVLDGKMSKKMARRMAEAQNRGAAATGGIIPSALTELPANGDAPSMLAHAEQLRVSRKPDRASSGAHKETGQHYVEIARTVVQDGDSHLLTESQVLASIDALKDRGLDMRDVVHTDVGVRPIVIPPNNMDGIYDMLGAPGAEEKFRSISLFLDPKIAANPQDQRHYQLEQTAAAHMIGLMDDKGSVADVWKMIGFDVSKPDGQLGAAAHLDDLTKRHGGDFQQALKDLRAEAGIRELSPHEITGVRRAVDKDLKKDPKKR